MATTATFSASHSIFAIVFASCLLRGFAQSISSDTPVPPLQWINLTGLVSGSSPPALKDASIGYDESARTLIIFGGESQAGIPQSGTHLLNLDTLTWSNPTPPNGLDDSPPARSAAISGGDFAASFRSAHIVVGGMGTSGPLNDVWAFDYINQFWHQVNTEGGPSRSHAVGGKDLRVSFNNTASPVNTFYLAGGIDSSGPVSLSDTWQLQLSGTLSSNLPDSLDGSWSQTTLDSSSIEALSGLGGTVVQQEVVAIGGCTGTSNATSSCASQVSYVINLSNDGITNPATCVAPRIGAAVAANQNSVLSNFGSQVFVVSGLFNTSLWDDGGGSEKGEVDVLDISAGSWSRILPSGDPGDNNNPAFPSAREGASTLSFTSGLVGTSRSSSSDTIMYGGRDASGNYLSELWLLRAYNGSITQSNQKWSGFGSGTLQTGVDADGEGVTIQYLTNCVSAIAPSSTTASHQSSASATGTASTAPPTSSSGPSTGAVTFDTSLLHKLLSPVSIVLLLPSTLLYRLGLPSTTAAQPSPRLVTLKYLAILIGVAAYGIGIAGLATSFTSVSQSSGSTAISRRSFSATGNVLKTAHGRAGLALCVALYGLIPILNFLYYGWRRMYGRPRVTVEEEKHSPERSNRNSTDTAEKLNSATLMGSSGNGHTTPQPDPGSSSENRPQRRRLHSWGGGGLLPGRYSNEIPASEDSVTAPESTEASGGHRAFEVVNRPQRSRHQSAGAISTMADHRSRTPVTPRSLGDVSWLQRRRSLHAAGELDYVLSQMNRQQPPTPGTAEVLSTSTRGLMNEIPSPPPRPIMPPRLETALHLLFHALVLALCVLSLQALWTRAPKATFAVFLIWTLAFYVALVALAWFGHPRNSSLSVLLNRFRGSHQYAAPPANASTPTPSRPLSIAGTDQYPFPTQAQTQSQGPYLHQPMVRPAHDDEFSASHGGHPDDIEEDSDDDEVTRQQRIEDEMGRRDVSIVTVPKRKLWITNPS